MTTAATTPAPGSADGAVTQSSGASIGSLIRRPETGALIGTVGIFIFFALFGGKEFLSAGGVAAWLNVAGELGIIAIPIGLLMISGELDLSVGSVIAASSMTFAIIGGYFKLPVALAFVVALLLGTLVGFINGQLVTRTRVPSFIVTLATQFALAGLTLGFSRLLTNNVSVPIDAGETFHALFGQFLANQFEVIIFWWILVIVVVGWILHVTKFGNWIFAIGGDLESARTTGIPTNRVKIALYMSSATAAAFVGISQTILYNSAQVAKGQSFVFNSIIAVVIGGVLLTGGYGSVFGIVLGTLTFSIVNQGIYFTGWNADWASLILGILLLAAVLMNNTFRKMALSYNPGAKTKKAKG
jgi:simple sugar transport system permease protein